MILATQSSEEWPGSLQANGPLLKDAVVAKRGCKFEKTEVPRREIHSEPLNTEKKQADNVWRVEEC